MTPYIGAPVRILAHLDDQPLLYREARVLREQGFLGVVTEYAGGDADDLWRWRVDFGDEYAYFETAELQVLT